MNTGDMSTATMSTATMSTAELPASTPLPASAESAASSLRGDSETQKSRRAISFVTAAAGLLWLVLLGLFAATSRPTTPFDVAVLCIIGAASSMVWLNGIRYFTMWASAPLWARRRQLGKQHTAMLRQRRLLRAPGAEPIARVALLYCTANDLNLAALRASRAQDYPVTTVILDDSGSDDIRNSIDEFTRESGARVVRRAHRTGFKAGNLNHGIRALLSEFDYFVILDSDGVIPADFVTRALRDFADHPDAGIVQGRHQAIAGETAFSTAFSGLLGTHIAVTQPARSATGFSIFMGRGAMISAQCYRAAGRIPEVVAEDLAFSLEVRLAGHTVHYNHELLCTEDYPIDYPAFRTQHEKMVEGAVEFLRRSWLRVLRSSLSPLEKTDLLLDQLMVPIMAIAGLALMLGSAALTATGASGIQPLWAMVATGLFGTAPLLPEVVRMARQRGLPTGLAFLGLTGALYASTLFVTLRATAKIAFGGRALFRITPKTTHRRSGWQTLRVLHLEIAIAVVTIIVAGLLLGSLTAGLPLIGPAGAAIALSALGGMRLRTRRARHRRTVVAR